MAVHTVFFIGKPGCGKGTQAKLLSDHTGWPVIGTSNELRTMIAEGGAVGKKIKETMDAGLLTPSWLASYIYLRAIFAVPEKESVIFDGANRTLPEAHIVLASLKWLARPFTIIHLMTSDEEVRSRVELRKREENRNDDRHMDKRLQEYYDLTDKVVDFYRHEGLLIDVHGESSREEIAAKVREILKIA